MTIFADKVLESTTTEGTNSYALDGAPSGFKTFVEGFGTGNKCAYYAANADGTIWELGLGTVTDATPDTLTRTTIYKSSSSDAKINWGAGTKYIYSIPSGHILSALLKTNIGSSRPAWLEAGGQWIDNSSTPWVWKLYDGTDDITVCNIDITNNTTDLARLDVDNAGNLKLVGASSTSSLTLYRKAATTAAALAELLFNAQNAGGSEITGALLRMQLTDATAGSEDGQLIVRLPIAGNDSNVAIFQAGLQVGFPTGGDPGFGKINASEYQLDGEIARLVIGSSTGENGFIKFSHGLIIQWGATPTTASTRTVDFPTAFPTACFVVLVTVNGGSPGSTNPVATILSTSQWTLSGGDNREHFWAAIGH